MLMFGEYSEFLVPTSAVGAGAWLFYRLFLRSDKRERDAFMEVKRQRDHYRSRAETSEGLLSDALQELNEYRLRFGAIEIHGERKMWHNGELARREIAHKEREIERLTAIIEGNDEDPQ
jgi:hypothetical protein